MVCHRWYVSYIFIFNLLHSVALNKKRPGLTELIVSFHLWFLAEATRFYEDCEHKIIVSISCFEVSSRLLGWTFYSENL